jgi:hypothetical protein
MVVAIDKWSLFGGGRLLRFDCMSKENNTSYNNNALTPTISCLNWTHNPVSVQTLLFEFFKTFQDKNFSRHFVMATMYLKSAI